MPNYHHLVYDIHCNDNIYLHVGVVIILNKHLRTVRKHHARV